MNAQAHVNALDWYHPLVGHSVKHQMAACDCDVGRWRESTGERSKSSSRSSFLALPRIPSTLPVSFLPHAVTFQHEIFATTNKVSNVALILPLLLHFILTRFTSLIQEPPWRLELCRILAVCASRSLVRRFDIAIADKTPVLTSAANAAVLYPLLMAKKLPDSFSSEKPPKFDLLTMGTGTTIFSILVHGDPCRKRIFIKGPMTASSFGAMELLMDATAKMLNEYYSENFYREHGTKEVSAAVRGHHSYTYYAHERDEPALSTIGRSCGDEAVVLSFSLGRELLGMHQD